MTPSEEQTADAIFFVLKLLVAAMFFAFLFGVCAGRYLGAAHHLELARQLEACETRARLEQRRGGEL